MGVRYYTCDNCGQTFADSGYFIKCESCFKKWCSDECAEVGGHVNEYCNKYTDLDDRDLMEEYREKNCLYEDCDDCNNCESASCKYCRKEDFDDSELILYVCGILKITRDELVEKYRKE